MSLFQKKLPQTTSALKEALKDTFPAYAAGVVHGNERFFHSENCGLTSLFDLASLTKVLVTTTLALLAEQRNLLSVTEPLQSFFPDFPDERVKLSHLLNHSAGFQAWLGLHEKFHAKNSKDGFDPLHTPKFARTAYEEAILKSFDGKAFEKECVYSDLGFLMLGWALEKKLGAPIDVLFQEWIAIPWGFRSLQYLPIHPDVVPTEVCPWRGHALRGEVHDDNTYVLGGVAAHAGLFGNVEEVTRFGEIWMQSYFGESAYLKPELTRRYWSFTHLPGQTRVLGWDSVSAKGSSTGQFFSRSARGHLGFTGTSLWMDPEKKLVVTLLTNRVYPTRQNEKIKAFRPIFHDAVITDLSLAKT